MPDPDVTRPEPSDLNGCPDSLVLRSDRTDEAFLRHAHEERLLGWDSGAPDRDERRGSVLSGGVGTA
jgi:hypothetical protein